MVNYNLNFASAHKIQRLFFIYLGSKCIIELIDQAEYRPFNEALKSNLPIAKEYILKPLL